MIGRQFTYLFLLLTSLSFSQLGTDKKAPCTLDFFTSNDTLTFFTRKATCDTVYYQKCQVFKNDKGIIVARQFYPFKTRLPKKCFDLERPDPKKFHFVIFCTGSMKNIDLLTLTDLELRIRLKSNVESNCNDNVIIYILSKNKTYKSKIDSHCSTFINEMFFTLHCIKLAYEK